MLFKESGNTVHELRRRSVLVNLANSSSFSEFYFESLFLKPVSSHAKVIENLLPSFAKISKW
jgi:hypothetical protein